MQPKPNRRSEVTLLRMTPEERAQRQGKTMTRRHYAQLAASTEQNAAKDPGSGGARRLRESRG